MSNSVHLFELIGVAMLLFRNVQHCSALVNLRV